MARPGGPGWRLHTSPRTLKVLERLTPRDQARLRGALDRLLTEPERLDLGPLHGRPEWRLRVGRWRVLLRVDYGERAVSVVAVGPRGDVYK